MQTKIADTREEMGRLAADDIAAALRHALAEKQRLRLVFAAAPSQSATLTALRDEPGIDWSRIEAFHMDEYIGLPEDAPQRFGLWLKETFFNHMPLAAVNFIEPGSNHEAAASSYAARLASAPIDIVLLGIGMNGHLAFNDPPADLNDPLPVKVVSLDQTCREQQVLDGCFPSLEAVPLQAITLTIPTLLSGSQLFCSVPGAHKSAAVQAMLTSPISGDCPATALRLHPRCTVYLDRESSSLLLRI